MPLVIEKEISDYINLISTDPSNSKINFHEFHAILQFYSDVDRSEEYKTKQIDCLVNASVKYRVPLATDWDIFDINWHDSINADIGAATCLMATIFVVGSTLFLNNIQMGNLPLPQIMGSLAYIGFYYYADYSPVPSNILFKEEVSQCISGETNNIE